MVVDRYWHRRGLASWGRADQRDLGGVATVDHQALGRDKTFQCGSVRGDRHLGDDGVGAVGGGEVALDPYRIVVVHPCMVHLEIRKLQSRR